LPENLHSKKFYATHFAMDLLCLLKVFFCPCLRFLKHGASLACKKCHVRRFAFIVIFTGWRSAIFVVLLFCLDAKK